MSKIPEKHLIPKEFVAWSSAKPFYPKVSDYTYLIKVSPQHFTDEDKDFYSFDLAFINTNGKSYLNELLFFSKSEKEEEAFNLFMDGFSKLLKDKKEELDELKKIFKDLQKANI